MTAASLSSEELARADAPQIPGRAGVSLVGPTLIMHGTEDQRINGAYIASLAMPTLWRGR